MAFFEKPAVVSHRQFYFWLLAGVVAVGVVWPLDSRVDAALDVTRNPALHRLAWWCSKIGEGWVVAVVGIFFAVVFLVMNLPRLAANVFFVGTVSLLAGLAATILRVLFGRTRPTAHTVQGFYGVWQNGHWLIGKYEFSSFPSGHSAVAAASRHSRGSTSMDTHPSRPAVRACTGARTSHAARTSSVVTRNTAVSTSAPRAARSASWSR